MSERPKSAYEITLEKLKQQDRERGESAPAALTDSQKKAIAEIRRVAQARAAEREILYRSERQKVLQDPDGAAKLQTIEEEYASDRRRIEADRDRQIEQVRAGKGRAT
jgi:predicted adenine nucleotide alpha hydrolase (AANH) superfamily ATPase